MPIEGGLDILNRFTFVFGAKVFIVLFLIFYAFFSLMLHRQIQFMSRKLPTVLNPHLRFLSILNIGVAIAVLFLVIGLF
ncbi:hypothetical protein A3J17_01995 [Candidatus Curtissbacteria bacterium RIFCSPLOWO2_02_FULL_40_11]|uniref:Uncharacterized protein n=2 Tax=Candidatus Curtissiibacteriota TaxID=1752717 RepID=A0A1F5GB84_9BACT|nr:MAG: hypothetical protein A2775_01310 [Candidatus Curtissbacteria bacterium RIFCSPHIGHO2_01_FULL_39_57]OGD89095.1 MAG: hypothetical protein A3D04_05060 [Candidatus Curtissbacteria bacterium RIFCSPHIGHO2_02_FULL_40_16b]OGE00548.1 MAG: hypothetical protein A3J17_01995 [Candidatus Curtissbacteria bacterium RIFCSPLOWO2_02_FULL_40_11]OGE13395.1 MAG: hypothetical protein A3G14_02915 [Candidatus Curtissbacteria bacterium RIFCSPLOWO2_12_FULL_38_9]